MYQNHKIFKVVKKVFHKKNVYQTSKVKQIL